MKLRNYLIVLLLSFSILGILDSAYLTKAHYSDFIPPCTNSFFVDCGKVLRSQYAVVLGVPLALLGLLHYSVLTVNILFSIVSGKKIFRYFILIQTVIGFVVSIYLMYLQFFVIQSICLYCTFSAVISLGLFITSFLYFRKERKELTAKKIAFLYQHIQKPILFLIDPEFVHERFVSLGQFLGSIPTARSYLGYALRREDASLTQIISGVTFKNPIGLAAGFDYDAKLTQILPSLDFGFETVGTVTNMSYKGNPRPMLGRLPKSKSLMVNKGFKSQGAKKIVKSLTGKIFEIPLGISIGRTNSPKLTTQQKSIRDIVLAFETFEESKVSHSYYELNISCPNIIHERHITFYPPKNLRELLSEIEKIKIRKPIFIKMPIEKTDKETLTMLEVISHFNIKGVVFGNLQKNRSDPALDQEEVRKFKVGNFSGKPTFKRSNELIKLAYKNFGKKLTIIGCGGVFNSKDAYLKIKLGASLVQLITGMIYQGPQLAAQINLELPELLKKDGFKHISETIGIEV